jgi:hypothetical protein
VTWKIRCMWRLVLQWVKWKDWRKSIKVKVQHGGLEGCCSRSVGCCNKSRTKLAIFISFAYQCHLSNSLFLTNIENNNDNNNTKQNLLLEYTLKQT